MSLPNDLTKHEYFNIYFKHIFNKKQTNQIVFLQILKYYSSILITS